MTLFEARNGELWIGTHDGGANVLDPVSGLIRQLPYGTAAGAISAANAEKIEKAKADLAEARAELAGLVDDPTKSKAGPEREKQMAAVRKRVQAIQNELVNLTDPAMNGPVAMGARVIALDISPERRKLAREFGANEVIDARSNNPVEAIRELTHGEGAHKTLDTSGAGEVRAAAARAART